MEYNDYELVYLAQEHNELALEILYKKYSVLIKNKAKKVLNLVKKSGLDINDCLLEVKLTFEEAVMSYDQDDKTLFLTYATICIDRLIINLVRRYNGKKYFFLNEATSLEIDEEAGLYGVITDNQTPEKELFEKEDMSFLYENITSKLKKDEREVFKLRLKGLTYNEISKKLNLDVKLVYRTIEKIKNKINENK